MKTPKSKYTLEKTGDLQYNVALYAKANPSTKNSSPRPRSRLSCTYGFKSRSSRPQGSSPQRPQETERLRTPSLVKSAPPGRFSFVLKTHPPAGGIATCSDGSEPALSFVYCCKRNKTASLNSLTPGQSQSKAAALRNSPPAGGSNSPRSESQKYPASLSGSLRGTV